MVMNALVVFIPACATIIGDDYLVLNLLQIAAEVADLSRDRHRKAFIGCVAVRPDNKIVAPE